MAWRTTQTDDSVIQVSPFDDEIENTEEVEWEIMPLDDAPLSKCTCGARREVENNKWLIIHNSFDGREGLEWAQEIFAK